MLTKYSYIPARKNGKPWIKRAVDYAMAEHCAEEIRERLKNGEACTKEELHNFVTALTALTYFKHPFGPNVKFLYHDLYAMYAYDHADKLKGFDLGAVYGATQFLFSLGECLH